VDGERELELGTTLREEANKLEKPRFPNWTLEDLG
jgi:hypothetical protein